VYRQDVAPPGGYPKLKIEPNMSGRKIPPIALLIGSGLLIGFGAWKTFTVIRDEIHLDEDMNEIKYYLLPVLKAETDRRAIKYLTDMEEIEEKVMQDEPNWVVGQSVYRTRWMPPYTWTYPYNLLYRKFGSPP